MAELGAHFAEAASRSGLGLDAALSLRAHTTRVSRAELLALLERDVAPLNRELAAQAPTWPPPHGPTCTPATRVAPAAAAQRPTGLQPARRLPRPVWGRAGGLA